MHRYNEFKPRALSGLRRYALLMALLFSSVSLNAEPLVISRVGGDIEDRVKSLFPVAKYVVDRLSSTPYDQAQVKYSLNQHELIRFIHEGEVHWVSESPYVAALLIHEAGMKPLLKRSKRGAYRYGSVLVSSRELNKVSQLVGKKVAAEDPGSFSAFFVIYRYLIEQGYKVNILVAPREPALADHINLVFSGDVENSVSWLVNGVVDASVMGDQEYRDSPLHSGSLQNRTHLLFESELYPRTIELVSNKVSADQQDQMRSLMLAMKHDPYAASILAASKKSAGFAALSQDELDQLAGIYRFIKERSALD